MRIPRLFIAGLIIAPISIAAIYFTGVPDRPPPHHDGLVFRLPATTLGCPTFEPADGETIFGWRFEQPITISVSHGKKVTIDKPYWDMRYESKLLFCTRIEATDHGVVNVKDGTMDFDPPKWDPGFVVLGDEPITFYISPR